MASEVLPVNFIAKLYLRMTRVALAFAFAAVAGATKTFRPMPGWDVASVRHLHEMDDGRIVYTGFMMPPAFGLKKMATVRNTAFVK